MTAFLAYNLFVNFEMHLSMDLLEYPLDKALVLRAGFRAGLAGLNLGYPENPALKPRKPSYVHQYSYVGLSWVSWDLKNYELGLAG